MGEYDLHLVLHEPEIPQNTGNIARTCTALDATLHLIKPLGFSLEDKYVKRSGMDYWERLNYIVWEDLDDFFQGIQREYGADPAEECFYISTKARQQLGQVEYPSRAFFLFGKESAGLPEYLMKNFPEQSLRIPMKPGIRSLNLSNAAAIIAYDHWKHFNFPGCESFN
ncbi:tRNA (cytidine(34)-2'-O)-methyltransferase [Salinispira pacifica]|uniref:Putative tRNA (cytidine(34)-2'-O)-methyltransferase n=1 Tax=Salinispira pacifica TaxID=1307761 RepID=V5WIY1_9SPIO|nr:tRNA (cytidine(34)-2'-O)-methyltransferase [Salinispira pacifica]AHC15575.1 tRNA (cytosine34-2'-O-)-methyltransferase [Salinispira pacifica]